MGARVLGLTGKAARLQISSLALPGPAEGLSGRGFGVGIWALRAPKGARV